MYPVNVSLHVESFHASGDSGIGRLIPQALCVMVHDAKERCDDGCQCW